LSTAADEALLPDGSVPTQVLQLRVGALVIADLHLAPGGDERTARFIAWCDDLVSDAVPQLIVMGDFFDTWGGAKQVRLAGTVEVLAALHRLVARGIEVCMIPGNRDALMGTAFEEASGAALFAEGFVALMPETGERFAFVHGDSLCTLDKGYQRLRRVWRRRSIRWLSRRMPLWIARRVAARLRAQSESRKAFKLEDQKSIRPVAVAALAESTGASAVVCGHAHDARDEALGEAGGSPVRFVVVGAWEWRDDVYRVGTGGRFAAQGE
jgi:UDP-2,3-diacylglucosamine hydrolase